MLVGEEGVNAFPSFYSCAVEDPDTDIVVIDPAAPDYTDITNLVCKNPPNGYDIKITEVNPIDNTPTGYPAFIEVLNRGATADIKACMGGTETKLATQRQSVLVVFVSSTSGSYGVHTLPTASPSVT